MKKLIFIALAVLLAAFLVVAFVVMPKSLSMTDVVAAEGDNIYVIVSLEKPVSANTMAISYEYDASVLEPLKADHQWSQQGYLQDFSQFGSYGVWCIEESPQQPSDRVHRFHRSAPCRRQDPGLR